MDLLVALAVMILTYIAINVESSNLLNTVWAFVPFIIGLFVTQEGLTFNGTPLTVVNTPLNMVLIAFLLLGSLGQFYLGLTRYRRKKVY